MGVETEELTTLAELTISNVLILYGNAGCTAISNPSKLISEITERELK